MKIEDNPWVNVDFSDVIKCREKYIPTGDHKENVACDITDHRWFDEVPFDKEKGIVFLAAGVLHYLIDETVKELIRDMAERFPGGLFIFFKRLITIALVLMALVSKKLQIYL